MIIVSQDKVANINYGNIEAIYLLEKNGKIEINVRGKYDYTIGKYETEERAKEILKEIKNDTRLDLGELGNLRKDETQQIKKITHHPARKAQN